jgi:ribosomal-protein-alanine N-acetyltransferase
MEGIIETDRIILRAWKESDKKPFALMNADPEVMRYFPKMLNEGESDALAARIERQMAQFGYGLWAAQEKASGGFMGFIGFNYTDFESDFTPCVEIGWRLAKAFWDRGYATEGAKACLAYGFGTLGLRDVYSFTSALNTRSEKVMRKIGMTKVKDFSHPKIDPANELCPHVLYRIAAS